MQAPPAGFMDAFSIQPQWLSHDMLCIISRKIHKTFIIFFKQENVHFQDLCFRPYSAFPATEESSSAEDILAALLL